MFFTRSLLLKGLAGVAAVGGVGTGLFVFRKEIFGVGGENKEKGAPAGVVGETKEGKGKDLSNFTQKDLIEKVGLSCQLTDNELTDGETKDCSVKANGTINVKVEDKEEEGVTFTVNGSKLKVSKSEGYTKNLKFVVDSGDISLTKGGSEATTISKLEQFETYEIFQREDNGKFYLRRKTDAKEEKIKALGLPSGCALPETGASECTLDTAQIKTVNFEKQGSEQITVSTGTVNLKITKMSDSTDFTDGYRFTFTFPSDVTINNKQLKANTPYDFKIKKGTGNALSLEKAWSEDKDFAKKAGLDCTNQSECNVSSTDPKLNVKVGTQKKTDISTIDTSKGKIKMETDQQGYNQGLKFTITKGDVTISNGTGGEGITKLEELETYEITEDGGKYYLTRKDEASKTIETQLGLPSSCKLSSTSSCTLTEEAFKNINFEGKSGTTGSGTLTISKVKNTTDFPLGYKFTFNTSEDATITTTTNIIKKNVPTDFKIKKNEGKAVSLEKAWSNYSLAEKVGLTCTDSSGCCTKTGTTKLNVKKGTDKKEGIDSVTTSSSKIKVEKDQAGYNQGLKFTISGGDVTLTGGSGGTFSSLSELETYEITEEGDKYYLTRKNEASKTIADLLGLPSTCKPSSSSVTCNGLTTEQIKKINFNDKATTGITMTSGTATLTITSASGADKDNFPLGYKFTLQSAQEITIKNNTNKVAANTNTEFKIKKNDSNPTSLSLEKVWTADSLGKKAGFKSCDESSKECTLENNNKLKVKQGDKQDTELTKSNGSSGKIKVEKDQAGYNQGFKFTISDASITLSGGTQNQEDKKIKSLDEYETYEIKEEGGQWYLVRKITADDFVLKELGELNKMDGCSSLKLPAPTDSAGDTCNISKVSDLKKIKFHNKESFSDWPTGTFTIQLTISKDTSLTSGFKFSFQESSSGDGNLCIPDGKGGSVNLKDSSYTSSGVDYKIKKSGDTLTLEKKD